LVIFFSRIKLQLQGPCSQTFLKFRDTRRASYRLFQKVISSGSSSSGRNTGLTAYWLSRQEIILKGAKTTTNKGKRVFRYGLGPGTVGSAFVYDAPNCKLLSL
jgi:hypothetical protein